MNSVSFFIYLRDTSDIKIHSVQSSVDTNDDAICIEESMDSDSEYIAPHLLQFSAVENSESSRPSASSKNDSPPFSKFQREPSPCDAGQRNGYSSTRRQIKTEEEDFDQRVQAIVEKRNDKIEELLTKIVLQGQEDSLDLFFRSVAMSVRKLQPNLIQEAKIRVLQLLTELEEKQSQSTVK